MHILISACLLGVPCRYSGEGCPLPGLGRLLTHPKAHFVPVCPEQLGGLPTPRPSAERVGERVLTDGGEDVTGPFQRGGAYTLELARKLGCGCALLKARSPSCGSGTIYDGTFTGRRVPGDGVTAALLKAAGIPVFDEEHWDSLLELLDREGME